MPGSVFPFHMDAHRFSGFERLLLKVGEDKMAQTLVSVPGKNSDINNSNICGTVIDVKSAHRNTIQEYDEKLGITILVLIIDMLGLKLLIEKGGFVLFGPLYHKGHFVFPGACIDIP